MVEFLIRRENQTIKEALEAANKFAVDIKKEIPSFQIVKMDSKEEIFELLDDYLKSEQEQRAKLFK